MAVGTVEKSIEPMACTGVMMSRRSGNLRSRLSLVSLCLLLCACEESTQPVNHAPVITDILADPVKAAVEDTVFLTVLASDADGDSLSYMWFASAGGLVDTAAVSVRWVAPAHSGEYVITVRVSDGDCSTEASKQLSTEGVLVQGFQDGEWVKENNPYIMVGDVKLHEAYLLVIREGVEVRARGTWEFMVAGTLHVLGTKEEPVVFTSDRAGPAPGDWKGIRYVMPFEPDLIHEGPFRCFFKWTVVEYGVTGIDAYHAGGNSPTIENCLIRRNSEAGIYCGGSHDYMNTIVRGTKICENGRVGVICNAGYKQWVSEAVLTECVIRDNGYVENASEDVFGGVYSLFFQGRIDSCAVVGNGAGGVGFGVRVEIVPFFAGLHNCILELNAGFDLDCRDVVGPYAPPDGKFDATGNYWGETATAEMEQGGNPKDISTICDKHDDSRLREVDYSAWLLEPPDIPQVWE